MYVPYNKTLRALGSEDAHIYNPVTVTLTDGSSMSAKLRVAINRVSGVMWHVHTWHVDMTDVVVRFVCMCVCHCVGR